MPERDDGSRVRSTSSSPASPRSPASPPRAGRTRSGPLPLLPLALLGALLAVLPVGSCASGPQSGESVRDHMFSGMWHMGSIPGRLIVGDVVGTRVPARWLQVQIDADPVMGDAARRAQMVALARDMEEATTVAEAARALGDLAAECGACHEAVGGPGLGDLGPLPVGSRLPTHMLRHVWAADRLWEGLFAADAGHWNAGADVLLEDPLPYFERMSERPDAARFARRLHELGDEATAASGRADRARVYGELLTTCADCHELMGIPRR